jgi:hypothetical protein
MPDRGRRPKVTGEQLRRLFDGRVDPPEPEQTLEAA